MSAGIFSPAVFIGLTVLLMGFAAYMTGAAIANTWRPVWQVVVYSLLLGAADRFLAFALFEQELLSLAGYVVDAGTLLLIASASFRFNRARRMVAQYPWLYERTGPFSWRRIGQKS